MKLIKVGAAVLNQTPFDWQNNTQNILGAIEQARKDNITILCLPELCITGYGCEDDFFRTDLRERAWQILKRDIMPATRGMIVSAGLPVMYNNALFNCAALVCDGKLLGLVAKQNLAGDGIHYEPRWFERWQEGVMDVLHADGQAFPIGDIYFSLGGVKVGFEICEDAWVGKRPGATLAPRGVDIFLNPSASHFAFRKMETRTRLVLEGSRAFCASYVYTNLLGDESGRAIYDGGAIIASAGHLHAVGPRFSFKQFEVTSAVIDVDLTRMMQARTYSYQPDLQSSDDNCIRADFNFPNVPVPPAACVEQPAWETSGHLKEEEFARSVSLGLFDYMRKTKARGYTVSLSGGADSSCVCVLVELMVAFAIQQLGVDAFKQKLAYMQDDLKDKNDAKSLTGALLSCAYQATANSSEGTLLSAKTVAAELGATFYEFDVNPALEDYTKMVETAIGRKLTWEQDDLTLQNIQARVRSPGIWMLANLRGSVLLCTSNRSEGAVGYCTMDGDTSGGLAPIAGVDKNFIRHWLRWMQSSGPLGLHAYPLLRIVNEQTPGPELRPLSAHQAGEQDLMPYDVLDAIEAAAIENNQSVTDCYRVISARFPQYSPKTIADWVEKFFRLWARNQWKRERLAPALHVASRNLDPRTWRRSPILSGGFSQEIKQMRELAEADEVKRNRQSAGAGIDSKHGKNGGGNGKKRHPALLVIDMQNGFGSHGEVPVPDAESIVPVINLLMPAFPIVVATQDWHPAKHVSFASRHGKKPGETVQIGDFAQLLFADHCVQNTPGSEFLPGLEIKEFDRVFHKGIKKDTDSFSAFRDNAGGKATEIEDFLWKNHVTDIYVTGLATNYCVFSTAMDANRAGFKVHVIADACRGIDQPPGAVQAALKKMRDAGIDITDSRHVLAELSAGKS